jgi:hypothetical protein
MLVSIFRRASSFSWGQQVRCSMLVYLSISTLLCARTGGNGTSYKVTAGVFCCISSRFLRPVCCTRKFLKGRRYVFGFVTLVGFGSAFGGIPFYKSELGMCYITTPPVASVCAFCTTVRVTMSKQPRQPSSIDNVSDFDSGYSFLHTSSWLLLIYLGHRVPRTSPICSSTTEKEFKMELQK